MKKILCLIILGLMAISMVGVVSAYTVVAGTVYNKGYNGVVEGANINIKCYDGEKLVGENNTISGANGIYVFQFLERGTNKCANGNNVVVTAEKDGSYASNFGEVVDYGVEVKLALIDVVIPEFGIFMGIFTLMAGVGVFFFIKKQ